MCYCGYNLIIHISTICGKGISPPKPTVASQNVFYLKYFIIGNR